MKGVSYLHNSESLKKQRQMSLQFGRLTRRDITEHKISMNIVKFNSPVAKKFYDNLRLGPYYQTSRFPPFKSN
jgi:hypothetical protein